MATPFQKHVANWKNCQRCPLSTARQHVVLCRGQLPAEILFIGEAPGQSEDTLAQPFIGPAGKFLDRIIDDALPGRMEFKEDGMTEVWTRDIRTAYTNMVACIPLDEDGDKTSQPSDSDILACSPRLLEFIKICDNPPNKSLRLIVCVGTLARDWFDTKYRDNVAKLMHRRPIETIDILHPAFILRQPYASQSLMRKQCIARISQATAKLFPERI